MRIMRVVEEEQMGVYCKCKSVEECNESEVSATTAEEITNRK